MNIIETAQLMFPGNLLWLLIGTILAAGYTHARIFHKKVYAIPGALLSICAGILMWIGIDNYLAAVNLGASVTILLRFVPIVFGLCIAMMITSPAWLKLKKPDERTA